MMETFTVTVLILTRDGQTLAGTRGGMTLEESLHYIKTIVPANFPSGADRATVSMEREL